MLTDVAQYWESAHTTFVGFTARQQTRVLDTFAGFPPETFSFLSSLTSHNKKEWFHAKRDTYQIYYVDVACSFIEAIGPQLRLLAPEINFSPRINGSLFRIQRDIRFSKDKTPYKTHLDMMFWHGQRKGWNGSSFFMRLLPQSLIVGVGCHKFDKEALTAYRAAIDGKEGAALQELRAKLSADGYQLSTPTRKRVPQGFSPDHKRADLLRCDNMTAMIDIVHPKAIGKAAFVDWCVAHFRCLLPLHRWLVLHLASS